MNCSGIFYNLNDKDSIAVIVQTVQQQYKWIININWQAHIHILVGQFKYMRGIIKASEALENMNTFVLYLNEPDTLRVTTHTVYTVTEHRGSYNQRPHGTMAQKKVMSPQIVPLSTMCPSTFWCRRGDGTITPLSQAPKIGCGHLRLPLSIHTDTWVVCGLPEPTPTSSTNALCDTGVVLSTLSILVSSGS